MAIDIHRHWMKDAACAGWPTKIFFHIDQDEVFLDAIERKQASAKARKLCEDCPVRIECQRDTVGEQYGYWGGLTASERQVVRVKRSATVARWPESEKKSVAALIIKLRDAADPQAWVEIERIVGLTGPAARYLYTWGHNPVHTEAVDLHLPGDTPDSVRIGEDERRLILNWRRAGVSMREISKRLGVAGTTVRDHVRSIEEEQRGKEVPAAVA